MEEVNVPVPLPSVVLLFDTVGAVAVFQHTPLAVTALPPISVTLPPLVAVVDKILVMDDVDSVGSVLE